MKSFSHIDDAHKHGTQWFCPGCENGMCVCRLTVGQQLPTGCVSKHCTIAVATFVNNHRLPAVSHVLREGL